jgi:hypothetical protein
MWPDNETDVDLLGFDILADGLLAALTEPRLLPLTVGVLGDWGSGKSSLMGLACAELTADPWARYACVQFSPWQYEDYEDVKAALMAAVLTELGTQAAGDAEQVAEIGKLKAFGQRFAGEAAGSRVAGWRSCLPPCLSSLTRSITRPTRGWSRSSSRARRQPRAT